MPRRYTANNYNGVMARNAKLTIVEAEEIVYVTVPDACGAVLNLITSPAGPSEAYLRTRSTSLACT